MDGTESTQDNQPSGESKETSYTEVQVAEIRRKAESDALSKAGRAQANAEKATKIATKALDELNKAKDRAYTEAKESYKHDSEKLNALEAGRWNDEAQAKLDEAGEKLSEANQMREAAEQAEQGVTRNKNVADVAARTGVDPKQLERFAKLTDGSVEAIEVEAKGLPKAADPQPALRIDGGGNAGSGTIYTPERLREISGQLHRMTLAERTEMMADIDKADREGRVRR